MTTTTNETAINPKQLFTTVARKFWENDTIFAGRFTLENLDGYRTAQGKTKLGIADIRAIHFIDEGFINEWGGAYDWSVQLANVTGQDPVHQSFIPCKNCQAEIRTTYISLTILPNGKILERMEDGVMVQQQRGNVAVERRTGSSKAAFMPTFYCEACRFTVDIRDDRNCKVPFRSYAHASALAKRLNAACGYIPKQPKEKKIVASEPVTAKNVTVGATAPLTGTARFATTQAQA